jgi:GNAT superfamily N-acetyltransferase
MTIEYRLALMSDIPALEELIPFSARKLQIGYYSREQIEGAIGSVFGVDRQLIKDGSYFVAVENGMIVGAGGWSKRKTLYGGDHGKKREEPLRDPATEPAMIRAFFVHPDHARRGIGRKLLELSERGAVRAGFARLEIIATLAGEPLYTSLGYGSVERFEIGLANGALMPVVRMRKEQAPSAMAPG